MMFFLRLRREYSNAQTKFPLDDIVRTIITDVKKKKNFNKNTGLSIQKTAYHHKKINGAERGVNIFSMKRAYNKRWGLRYWRVRIGNQRQRFRCSYYRYEDFFLFSLVLVLILVNYS